MQILIKATHNENGSWMNVEIVDINLVDAIAINPYTHRYYRIGEKVGNAFKDSLSLKD